jgi:hypothetical protein
MTTRGIEFANRWIAENIQAPVYPEADGMTAEAEAAVRQLLADAAEEGISRTEIEEDMGDIDDLVLSAFEEAADAELDRMIDDED